MVKFVAELGPPVVLAQFVMLINKWTGLYADKGWDWVLFPIGVYCVVLVVAACIESLVKE